ncbi:MAG TPA: type II toxin-antitoxin system prevent-host-death family antitoxin [Beijerinckiaceae bacterium]
MPREQTITASAFRTRCFEILGQIESGKLDQVTVTKRGRPVAVIGPAPVRTPIKGSLHGCMRGTVIIPPDFNLEAPALRPEDLIG